MDVSGPLKSYVALVKVGECLYRNPSSKTYFALIKRKGKQIKKSLKTQDRKLAGRRLKELKERADSLAGRGGTERALFEEFSARWLSNKAVHVKPSSFKRLQLCVETLNRHFRGKSLANIERVDCEMWAKARGAKALSASTFNKDLQTLKNILEYGVDCGLLLDNPAKALQRRKGGSRAVLIPTKKEFGKLVGALEQLGDRASEAALLVKLLAWSGMRLGEAVSICWANIDFRRRRFVVAGEAYGTKNREERIVPLFPNLAVFLWDLRAESKPAPEERIVGIESAKKAMATACVKAALPHLTHHCLRHYFVSNAIERGIDFKTIAAWIGHKDGGVLVAKTYGHLRDTHSMEMAKRMVD